MSNHFAGTSGYAYKPWKGPFYPEDLPQQKMLDFYSLHLPSVEINNTFYRLPKKEVLQAWSDAVPQHFRFSIKASRRITHIRKLNEGATEALDYLLATTAVLGEKLGALLFQLPPNMGLNQERLDSFLDRLPTGGRYAFEFRNASWFCDEVYESLNRAGAALCLADTGDPECDAPWVQTADWGYLRLRREGYDQGQIESFAQRVSESGWTESYTFFKHEDAGAGPRLARRFLDALGSTEASA